MDYHTRGHMVVQLLTTRLLLKSNQMYATHNIVIFEFYTLTKLKSRKIKNGLRRQSIERTQDTSYENRSRLLYNFSIPHGYNIMACS
jgi:hypothetical protein